MDTSRLITVATALSLLAIGVADAASKQKRQRVRDSAPVSMQQASDSARTPAYARYGCHTDDGYGRFWPCGAGPK